LRLERLVTPALLEAGLKEGGKQGEAESRFALRELDQLRQGVAGQAALALLDAPWTLIFVAVCFLLHPWIGWLTTFGAALLFCIAFLNQRALRQGMERVTERLPHIQRAQDEELNAGEAVRALGMRRTLIEKQLQRRIEINDLQTEIQFRSIRYTSASKFSRLALQSASLGVGAFLAVMGEMSPGALIAASILSARALQPMEQIVGAWRQISQMRSAFNTVSKVLRAHPPSVSRVGLPAPNGELRFERVHVRLPQTNAWILNDVSFGLRPGEIMAVVGQSGAGKSTLARVAAGALVPELGVVRIDNANMADWEPDALGAHIGYLPQDIALLSGTVSENIRRFGRAYDEDDLDDATIAAAKAAFVHDLIQRLPQGYNTALGVQGRGVSVGQAQRIAFARALYGSPALLVLDEPNAHLDAEGEQALIEALRVAKSRGAAVLIVAHRAGVLAVVDRVLVLKAGRVDMIGERDEVLRRLSGGGEQPVAQMARPGGGR
jgi:ATP-binding cassette subfamily C protein